MFASVKDGILENEEILKIGYEARPLKMKDVKIRKYLNVCDLADAMSIDTSHLTASQKPSAFMQRFLKQRYVKSEADAKDIGYNEAHALLKVFYAMDTARLYYDPIPVLPIRHSVS